MPLSSARDSARRAHLVASAIKIDGVHLESVFRNISELHLSEVRFEQELIDATIEINDNVADFNEAILFWDIACKARGFS